MGTQKQMPHIGNLVEKVLTERKMLKADLARGIGMTRISVNNYIKEPSLQARILWKITKATGFDFFAYLSNSMDDNATENSKVSLQNEKQALEERVKDLEKELAIYKEIVLKKG